MLKKMIPLSLIVCLSLSSCMPQSKTGKGGLYGAAGGAAAGAILGQAIGHDTEATLWGAAIGAALGGAAGAGVGKYMDNQEEEMRQALEASQAAAVQREGNLLSVMFKGDVTFDHNSAVVRPGLYNEIDRVANVLNQYPQTLIRVEGHTDSTGSEQYNLDLSRRRAEAVRNLLVQRNVSASRMEVVGYGEAKPVATNETEAGRQMNRRVELKIAPTKEAGTSPPAS
jgi:outer membrane protein OmpA-like peptidoglycan-associated protein